MKTRKLIEFLHQNPHIKGVWIDYCCLPQGNRSTHEDSFFRTTLENVNLLYLCGKTLALIDQKYAGRFWTQYELFLALHQAGKDGFSVIAADKVREKCRVIEIGAAAASGGKFADALVATWAHRNVHEAVRILKHGDVEVTNMKDKELLLPKLYDVEERITKIVRGMVPI